VQVTGGYKVGIYYAYANDEKQEIIFPDISDEEGLAGPKKQNLLARNHPIHFLLCVAFMYRWCNDYVRLCDDGEDAYFDYKDVTVDLVKIANEKVGTTFTYKPDLES